MNHPDLDRLTSWVHGFLEADDAGSAEAHVSSCAECRETANALREESRVVSRGMARPERLAELKEGLLRAAGGRRPGRGLLWQIPVAAAVLFSLVAVLVSPGARHSIVDGRVTLEDGRLVAAPMDLAASRSWQLRAVDPVTVRLSDRSIVDLAAGARFSLAPGGARGVQAALSSGEATFTVLPDSQRLSIVSPAGRVEAADGKFSVRIVFENEGGIPVKHALAGAIVTVFAGSISLSNAGGAVVAQPGQSAVLGRSEAPMLLMAPQDKQEGLLRRLEQLAARVAKLEDEIVQLERKNKQLKQQLTASAPGASAGGGPGGVIIERKEEDEKKLERKNPAPKER